MTNIQSREKKQSVNTRRDSRSAISPAFDPIRIPPHNVDAEIATLGSLFLDAKAIDKVIDKLSEYDFHRFEHQLIFNTVLELFEKRIPVDVIAVTNRLKEKNALDDVGGSSYLVSLVNAVPSASNVNYYADIVRNKKVLRDLIEASHFISDLGYREHEDIEVLLDEAEQRIFGIAQKSIKQRFTVLKDTLEEAWERIENSHKGDGALRGLPTGFISLDNILAGLQKSDLIIVAARPSLGKTSFALDVARNASVNLGIPTAIFSLEMSAPQLVDRLIASEAMVDQWKLRTGKLSTDSDDFTRITNALARLQKAPLFIDADASNNVLQMRSKARRLQAEHKLGLIIVDYLQLIQPRGNTDNVVQQITEISRSLKALAKELDVPVLAISQLSRAVEARHPPIPRLSDLRDSGSIEQDADVVMFIYREDKYRKDESTKTNQADIIIDKHRNGPTGKVTLYFNEEKMRFFDLERNYNEPVKNQ